MFSNLKKVLVVAPHTDDAEFGCGGTIARMIDEGLDVHIAAFSACEKSVPKRFPETILIDELKKATQVLGLPKENLHMFRYDVRIFKALRQEILQDLISLRKLIHPEIVFLPSSSDLHQDHSTIYAEGIRAFKFNSILGYEMPWNNMIFATSSFIFLNEKHIAKKIEALKEYKSQGHRPYSNEEFIRSLARTRGVQINTHYAEAFEVIRWVIK
tara:strand:+ start:757 stop:1395 length:639 start_codon:yes stop_codon:yes gene_type:complete